MKSFNTIDEKNNNHSAVTDFLDSLDTNMNSPINSENVNNTEDIPKEVTALVVQKPNSLFVAQTMFRKSIKLSIKSFLISLSLGFLNLFL